MDRGYRTTVGLGNGTTVGRFWVIDPCRGRSAKHVDVCGRSALRQAPARLPLRLPPLPTAYGGGPRLGGLPPTTRILGRPLIYSSPTPTNGRAPPYDTKKPPPEPPRTDVNVHGGAPPASPTLSPPNQCPTPPPRPRNAAAPLVPPATPSASRPPLPPARPTRQNKPPPRPPSTAPMKKPPPETDKEAPTSVCPPARGQPNPVNPVPPPVPPPQTALSLGAVLPASNPPG